jgi:8-oxo-dGTP diphosphatase
MSEKRTEISVGVVVFKGDSILFGRTKDKEGRTRHILPVGHLEFMESFSDCARREIAEECGIEIKNIKFHFVSNTDNYKPSHFVHIGLVAEWKSGEPEVLEVGAIEAWEWIDRKDMPENLSVGAALTIQAIEEELTMYDIEV